MLCARCVHVRPECEPCIEGVPCPPCFGAEMIVTGVLASLIAMAALFLAISDFRAFSKRG